MKKYLALTFILSFFASLALIACSYDAGNPPQAPHLGAIAAIQFGGDLDGSYVSQTVVGLQNNPLPAPSVGALQYDGGSLYWGAVTSVGHGSAGQLLATNDAGAATAWVYPHGDVDASATDPGDLTVNAIQGYGVSASVPTTGNQLRWSGSLWGPAALNLAGGSGYVTGTLPTANQASQTLGGELSGTTASGVVAGPFSTASMSWLASVSSPTWTQATPSSDVATQNLTLSPQAPYASAATHVDAGDVIVNTPASISGSSKYGGFQIQGASTPVIRMGQYATGTSFAAIWFVDGGSPGSTNYGFLGNQSATYLNAPSSSANLYLLGGNNVMANFIYTSATMALGGTIGSAPLQFYWGGNAPTIQSGTSATSLTIGTNKSGAALQLGGDAAANVAKLTTSFEHQTFADWDSVTTPSAPAANTHRQYTDSDGRLKVQDSLGNTVVLQ